MALENVNVAYSLEGSRGFRIIVFSTRETCTYFSRRETDQNIHNQDNLSVWIVALAKHFYHREIVNKFFLWNNFRVL